MLIRLTQACLLPSCLYAGLVGLYTMGDNNLRHAYIFSLAGETGIENQTVILPKSRQAVPRYPDLSRGARDQFADHAAVRFDDRLGVRETCPVQAGAHRLQGKSLSDGQVSLHDPKCGAHRFRRLFG